MFGNKVKKNDKLQILFFNDVYDVLVEAGAAPNMRNSFVSAHVDKGNEKYGVCREWRFQGHLGFGGKYWISRNKVDCYSEDFNKETEALITKINSKLADLFEKYDGLGLHIPEYRAY